MDALREIGNTPPLERVNSLPLQRKNAVPKKDRKNSSFTSLNIPKLDLDRIQSKKIAAKIEIPPSLTPVQEGILRVALYFQELLAVGFADTNAKIERILSQSRTFVTAFERKLSSDANRLTNTMGAPLLNKFNRIAASYRSALESPPAVKEGSCYSTWKMNIKACKDDWLRIRKQLVNQLDKLGEAGILDDLKFTYGSCVFDQLLLGFKYQTDLLQEMKRALARDLMAKYPEQVKSVFEGRVGLEEDCLYESLASLSDYDLMMANYHLGGQLQDSMIGGNRSYKSAFFTLIEQVTKPLAEGQGAQSSDLRLNNLIANWLAHIIQVRDTYVRFLSQLSDTPATAFLNGFVALGQSPPLPPPSSAERENIMQRTLDKFTQGALDRLVDARNATVEIGGQNLTLSLKKLVECEELAGICESLIASIHSLHKEILQSILMIDASALHSAHQKFLEFCQTEQERQNTNFLVVKGICQKFGISLEDDLSISQTHVKQALSVLKKTANVVSRRLSDQGTEPPKRTRSGPPTAGRFHSMDSLSSFT